MLRFYGSLCTISVPATIAEDAALRVAECIKTRPVHDPEQTKEAQRGQDPVDLAAGLLRRNANCLRQLLSLTQSLSFLASF